MSDISYKTLPALAAYIDRVGAEQLNIRRFMIKTWHGKYYVERVLIRIDDEGNVHCSSKEHAPTEKEAEDIKTAVNAVNFPRTIAASEAQVKLLLPLLREGSVHYEFYNREGEVTMVQERATIKGSKVYLPWTFFSDGRWRSMEPDGPLPFWRPRVAAAKTRIMIHEGAKAAKAVNEIISDPKSTHPWKDWLEDYEHWGMIGGALAPHRTNYDDLRRGQPTEVIYVCDNDSQGESALQEVSRCFGGKLKGMRFGTAFPNSWDMADEMPRAFFTEKGRYVGPDPRELLEPATWATESVPSPGKGRPITRISRDFAEEWHHTVIPELYIHKNWPNRMYDLGQFNNFVRPFSDADDVGRILKRDKASKACLLKYSPSAPSGVYHSETGHFVNVHVPSGVKPERGDPGPWIDLTEYMIPEEGDRLEFYRWCATLIARPEVRMHYGLLLISETQGVGKGTVCDGVLAPIVGRHNVSYPTEETIVNSNFNSWVAHKRLAVVHEIYAGHSAKAYNKMKSIVTDEIVEVNKKYTHEYILENWLHVAACSNSLGALRLSVDDRRWLVPKVVEEKRPTAFWTEFYRWLREENGHGVIVWWANEFLKKYQAVQKGDAAPWTTHKQEVIEESYSPGMQFTSEIFRRLRAIIEGSYPEDLKRLTSLRMIHEGHAFVRDVDVIQAIKNVVNNGHRSDFLERPHTIRKVAKMEGWHSGRKTLVRKLGPEMFRPICSTKGMAEKPIVDIIGAEELVPVDVNLLARV